MINSRAMYKAKKTQILCLKKTKWKNCEKIKLIKPNDKLFFIFIIVEKNNFYEKI